MSSFWSSFGFKGTGGGADELPNLFPLSVKSTDFIEIDVQNIFQKIMVDTVERTHGIPEKVVHALWDNCLASESSEGLITMVSKAIVNKSDLFIVWDSATEVLRKATQDEEKKIKEDYSKQSKSSIGVFVSFKNYKKSDILKMYSALEYCTIGSLNKNMNLSNAVQFKMADMRASTSVTDSSDVIAQAKLVAKALQDGKAVLIDAKDMIETGKPEMTATEKSMDFINERRSFYLGLPKSYVSGIQAGGMGDSGKSDTKAIERGLKNYYFSIIKPIIEAVFECKTSFKSDDFEMLDSGLNALRTFDLTSDDYLSRENKAVIISKVFGVYPEKPPNKDEQVPGADSQQPGQNPEPVNGKQ
jgi:hypothetical protein